MFKIIKNEWRLIIREKALLLATSLLVVCVAYALFNGKVWHQKRTVAVQTTIAQADSALIKQQSALAEIEAKGNSFENAPTAGRPELATYQAALPPGPLSMFSIGQADLYPYEAPILTWKRKDDLFRFYQIQSPISLSAGKFDLSFVVIYLLPLLIIALSYNLLSEEREKGTLAMMLSQPLTLTKLITGKLILRLIMITLFVILLGLVGYFFSMKNAGELIGRLLLWLTMSVLYTWFWFILAALVNAFRRSSESNATILTSLWLLFVLILPALLNLYVNWSSSVPSRFEHISAIRSAENDAHLKSSELLNKYYHDHPEFVAEEKRSDFFSKYIAVQRTVEEEVMPVVNDYENRLVRQQELISYFRFISPAIMLQEAFNDIAGSGRARQHEYTQQVRQYFTAWQAFISSKFFRNERLSSADYDALPRFEYQEETLASVVSRVAPTYLGLIIPILLFIALGLFKLRKFSFA